MFYIDINFLSHKLLHTLSLSSFIWAFYMWNLVNKHILHDSKFGSFTVSFRLLSTWKRFVGSMYKRSWLACYAFVLFQNFLVFVISSLGHSIVLFCTHFPEMQLKLLHWLSYLFAQCGFLVLFLSDILQILLS